MTASTERKATHWAIPGQGGPPGPPPPPGETARAITAVEAAWERYQRHTGFWFCPEPLGARMQRSFGEDALVMLIHPRDLRRSSAPLLLYWRWRTLRRGDGWRDWGWLPSDRWLALTIEAQDVVGEALNGPNRPRWITAYGTRN